MIYAIVFTARLKESGEWASRVSGTKTDFGEAKAFSTPSVQGLSEMQDLPMKW